MKTRPIPFSGPMVRAVLDGSKTQTRRIVKPWQAPSTPNGKPRPVPADLAYLSDFTCYRTTCPYGAPGDQLWVREAWRTDPRFDHLPPSKIRRDAPVQYEAGPYPDVLGGRLRPGMFMPRWAPRITLEVTGVRVERLQACSEGDALAEGITLEGGMFRNGSDVEFDTARDAYAALWESINGPGSWDANPWVWVVEFRRV